MLLVGSNDLVAELDKNLYFTKINSDFKTNGSILESSPCEKFLKINSYVHTLSLHFIFFHKSSQINKKYNYLIEQDSSLIR